MDQLGRLAALREADRPQTARRERGEEPRSVAERARAQPELGVEQRRVPDDDLALGLGGGVRVDDGGGLARQLERELARVRDRCRCEQELRLGVVDPREPPQPPQDVRDVGAEHAAVHVRLVDDDVAQVREDVAPAVVVREDADVEHVGVRQDDVRPLADLPAPLARRVAVVDRGPQALQPELRERAGLVLRERLRRVEVERPRLRLARDRVEHGQVERERLSRGRAGRDDDVLATLAASHVSAWWRKSAVTPFATSDEATRGSRSSGSGSSVGSREGSIPEYAISSPSSRSAQLAATVVTGAARTRARSALSAARRTPSPSARRPRRG